MFCIIDKATGAKLPVGGSSAEFSRTKAPRLFSKRSHAENALDCWRQGRWHNNIDSYGDGEGPVPWDSTSNRKLAAERQAMDLAVAEVRLEVTVL